MKSTHTFAIVALAVSTAFLTACSGSPSSSTTGGSSTTASVTLPKGVTPGVKALYSFTEVDDPKGANNKVTGISNNGTIVGVYYGSLHQFNSFSSPQDSGGGYTTFNNANFPDAHVEAENTPSPGGTYITSITTTSTTPIIDAGYAYNPGGGQGSGHGSEIGVWGVASNQGLWSIQKLHEAEASEHCVVSQLNGINHLGYAIGAFLATTPEGCGQLKAFYEQPGEGSSNINPTTGDSFISVGTGINSNCSIVGWLQPTESSGGYEGFYGIPSGNKCALGGMSYHYIDALSYNNLRYSTQILALNSLNPPQMVGSYTTGSGKNAVTHGFVLVIQSSGSTTWQSIDEPNANGVTVISGINDNGQICGWYNDSSGNLHGFVGVAGDDRSRHRSRSR